MRTGLIYELASAYIDTGVKEKVLVFLVDDDPMFLALLQDYLRKKDIELFSFASGEECLKNLGKNPDIIILDHYLNGDSPGAMTGLELLKKVKRKCPDTEVIILSAQEEIEVAIESLKEGAYDYFTKSEDALEKTRSAVKNLTDQALLRKIGDKETVKFNRTNIILFLILIIFMLTRIFQ
jgi:two-component system, OmpR family, response regulator